MKDSISLMNSDRVKVERLLGNERLLIEVICQVVSNVSSILSSTRYTICITKQASYVQI